MTELHIGVLIRLHLHTNLQQVAFILFTNDCNFETTMALFSLALGLEPHIMVALPLHWNQRLVSVIAV